MKKAPMNPLQQIAVQSIECSRFPFQALAFNHRMQAQKGCAASVRLMARMARMARKGLARV